MRCATIGPIISPRPLDRTHSTRARMPLGLGSHLTHKQQQGGQRQGELSERGRQRTMAGGRQRCWAPPLPKEGGPPCLPGTGRDESHSWSKRARARCGAALPGHCCCSPQKGQLFGREGAGARRCPRRASCGCAGLPHSPRAHHVLYSAAHPCTHTVCRLWWDNAHRTTPSEWQLRSVPPRAGPTTTPRARSSSCPPLRAPCGWSTRWSATRPRRADQAPTRLGPRRRRRCRLLVLVLLHLHTTHHGRHHQR